MENTQNFQPVDRKRRRAQKPERHDARKFIEPIKLKVREAFRNTGENEQVSRYYESTIRSTTDVVIEGHGQQIESQGVRLAEIESRLGLRKPVGREGLALVARRTA